MKRTSNYSPLYHIQYAKDASVKCSKTQAVLPDSFNKMIKLSSNQYLTASFEAIVLWSSDLKQSLFALNDAQGIRALIELPHNKIAYASKNIVKVYSLDLREYICEFSDHEWAVNALVAYKEEQIVSCSNDKTIRVFDIEEECCVLCLLAHDWVINEIILLESQVLVSCSWDSTIKFWDVEEEECIESIEVNDKNVISIRQISEGVLVSCSEDFFLRLWCLKSYVCLFELNAHNEATLYLHFIAEINCLVTCTEDNQIKLWQYDDVKKELSCVCVLVDDCGFLKSFSVIHEKRLIIACFLGKNVFWKY